jgi:hypothetical protein
MTSTHRCFLLVLAPLAAFFIAATWVEACGPEWVQLLPARQRELREPVPFVLADELKAITLRSPLDAATRQVLVADALKPTVVADYEMPAGRAQRWLKAQQQGLAAPVAQAFATARQAADGDASEAAAKAAVPPLDPAHRLYAAAASDLRTGHVDAARKRFEQLLALPPDQAKPMAVWAAYSLGRLLRHTDQAAAAQAFASARRWRVQGAPDPLGLAVDSLGEEARLHIHFDAAGKPQFDDADDARFVAALRLYFEQARLGSHAGVDSLRLLQGSIAQPERLRLLLAEDWGQALIVRLYSDQGFWVDAAEAQQRYQRLAAAINAAPAPHLAEPERWAALAWQQGDLAHARAWVGDAPRTALGAWTRAKLALADGKPADAARWFAAAVQAWPKGEAGSPWQRRLRAEQGLLQLQRGELPLGLRALLASGDDYWLDTAFVAERLLTSAELRVVVDDIAPAVTADANAQRLRHLLARRLMREGRFADAMAYFPAHYSVDRWTQSGSQTVTLDLPALARQYVDALASAERAWTRIGRADALLAAGHLAREQGMALMGFELAPDGFWADGGFDMAGGTPLEPPVGAVEAQRLAQAQATQPLPAGVSGTALPRFHYRYVAAQHALQAAALLPARSQAFASSLCHAALWVGVRDDAFQSATWARYVREGARVPWASTFGHDCAEPDLPGAWRLQAREDLHQALPWLHRHPRRSQGAVALVTTGLLAWALWAWRRRALPPA